jgi:periplasmic protein CpxP/Spy
MSKTRFLTLAVVALVALNVAVLAFLLVGRRPHRPPIVREIIVEHLHFDAQQVANYDRLIEKHRAEIDQKDTELVAARQAIYQLLKAEDFVKKDSLIAEVGRLQMAVEQIHFAHFQDIKKLCRPEQRANFDALVDNLAAYFPMKKGPKKNRKQ